MKSRRTYKEYIRFKTYFILLLGAATALTALLAVSAGSAGLSLTEVVATLLGYGSEQQSIVVFNIRMPRVVTAIVAGIGLATVGCVMQSILRNPLASASTLGICPGSCLWCILCNYRAGSRNAESNAGRRYHFQPLSGFRLRFCQRHDVNLHCVGIVSLQ